MRARSLRRRLALAAFGALLAGAMLGTGVAKANPTNDANFLHALDAQGITYPNPSFAIGVGHAICLDLAEGVSVAKEVDRCGC